MAHGNLILDRYEPVGTAGAGGFGTVQIAWDPRIQRKVAIKTIHLTEQDAYRAALPGAQAVAAPDAGDQDEAATGADGRDEAAPVREGRPLDQVTSLAHLPGLDEARTAALLSDPRIVTVFDFEVRGRTAYLIMEYVEGITLTRLLAQYSDYLTLDMVAAVFSSVAGALQVAHDGGVLHLDIKPDNILINPKGEVKVTDFGLATLADASGSGTTGGGTIGYMPLEQMRREHLDARTDEWSLAAVLYEMLTGDNPFRVKGLEAAEAAIENAELVLPSLCWQNIDEQIDDVVFYALDPDREERYASVADFAEEAEKFLGDPATGQEQLVLVVEDALGSYEQLPEAGDSDKAPKSRAVPRPSRLGFLRSFLAAKPAAAKPADGPKRPIDKLADRDWHEDDFVEDADEDFDDDRVPRGGSRVSLSERFGTLAYARAFAALASGALSLLAALNFPPLAALGPGQPVAVAVMCVAPLVLGALFPHVGALAAYLLLGASLVVCGQPVIGAVLIVAAAFWWYAVGHEGVAAANVSLFAPLAGALGGAPAAALVSGAVLKPVQAIATTAFCSVAAFTLATLGSQTVLGWDVFANWSYAQHDMGASALATLTKPETWAAVVSWMIATAVMSFSFARESRWIRVVSVIGGLALVLVGALVFSAPSAPLIAVVSLTTVVLLVVFARR